MWCGDVRSVHVWVWRCEECACAGHTTETSKYVVVHVAGL